MPSAFGYILLGASRLRSELDALRGQIEAFGRERMPELAWGGVYIDVATERFCSLERRKAGGELNLRVCQGDCVIAARLFDVLDHPDHLRVVNNWKRRGATFHALDIQAGLSEEEIAEVWRVASALSAWAQESSKKRSARAIATKRATGRVLNQAVPLGFKLAGPRGRRRVVPNREERTVMALIYQWRTDEKLSFYKIAVRLWQQRVRRRGGREWSEEGVRTAFKAECQLRAKEQGDEGPADPRN